jgi:transposase InsO family protein
MELTMRERQALARVTAPRYRKADKAKKTAILTEFCHNSGYNRKYAITVLRQIGKKHLRHIDGKTVNVLIVSKSHKKRIYQSYYDEPVKQAVLRLWEFFHFICGKRLVPLIRENLDSLAASRRFGIRGEVRKKLALISRSTVERMLHSERIKKPKGSCSTKPGTLLKQHIPVRTFWHWDDKTPGFCEIDTVSHGGDFTLGHFAYTLTLTDVCLGWTELRPLKNKARLWTISALNDMLSSFPIPIKGIDSDNGAEFINWHLLDWCKKLKINFTRGRQYHKNDNAYVEQKNGDVVRKTVGYGRLEGDDAFAALAAVYSAVCPLLNFFYPSMKCIDTLRVGQKVKRIYEKEPKTPFQRIQEHAEIPQAVKQCLATKKAALNIVTLQDTLDKAVDNLMKQVQHNPGGTHRQEAHG